MLKTVIFSSESTSVYQYKIDYFQALNFQQYFTRISWVVFYRTASHFPVPHNYETQLAAASFLLFFAMTFSPSPSDCG